jgi:putative phosphoribosyl transferase
MRPVVLLRRLGAAWDASRVFEDRPDAARELIDRLAEYRGRDPLVLGIPRGAVPMARLVADALGGEVDVVLVRKLGAPGNPEFAIGAVDESGVSLVTGDAASVGASADYIEAETRRQLDILRQRRALYTVQRAPVDPGGRIVIVLDDGLATGSTMIAALQALRRRGPSRLICAVPVAPPDTARKVAENCDELVCLRTPADFYAVGQFYRHFPQVGDDEVVAALAGASTRQSAARPRAM